MEKVRALPATRGGNTPAIALTAYARTEDRVRAYAAGFQIHISKPVEAAELITVMANLSGRSKTQLSWVQIFKQVRYRSALATKKVLPKEKPRGWNFKRRK